MTKTIVRTPGRASVRRAPRQKRAVARRSKIVAGAKELLASEGVKRFSMRAVAKSSGVGLGTIYDYFPSRSDILHALIEARLEHRIKIFENTLSQVTFDQGLAVFVPAYVQRLVQEGFWSRYDQELRNATQADGALVNVYAWYEREMASQYVEGMIAAGSDWPHDRLMQVAQFNMRVSQQLECVCEAGNSEINLSTEMVANALIFNLKMTLKPYEKSGTQKRSKDNKRTIKGEN